LFFSEPVDPAALLWSEKEQRYAVSPFENVVGKACVVVVAHDAP
jgi:hypothetical protein